MRPTDASYLRTIPFLVFSIAARMNQRQQHVIADLTVLSKPKLLQARHRPEWYGIFPASQENRHLSGTLFSQGYDQGNMANPNEENNDHDRRDERLREPPRQ
jgi:hypothetical protein